MSCSCDCEQPSVYRVATHRARRTHACCECAGPIAPGESYEYVFAVWDGEAGTVRTCGACLELRGWVQEVTDCRPCHSELVEEAVEEVRNMNGPRTPEVRRLWWQGARLYIRACQRQEKAYAARRLAKAAAALQVAA